MLRWMRSRDAPISRSAFCCIVWNWLIRAVSAASGWAPFRARTSGSSAVPFRLDLRLQRLGALLELGALPLERGVGGRALGAGPENLVDVDDGDDRRGQLLRAQRDRSGDGERGDRRAEDESSFSLECGPYVEAEKFGVVARLAEQGTGDVDAERPEGRVPVDPEADREAGAWRVAEEGLADTAPCGRRR